MKAKNSFLGRVLRRLLGEETGAVMMEYIVVALLIAAVAVVAISAFGGYASELFGTLGHFMGGRSTKGRDSLNRADVTYDANIVISSEHVKKTVDEEITRSEAPEGGRGN